MKNKALIFSVVAALAGVGMGGCATNISSGRAPAAYETLAPLYVNVGNVEVISQYNPASDPTDVSSKFATPPDLAMQRYAQNRIRANGSMDTVKFIIQNASVHHKVVQPPNSVGEWLGVGVQDEFEVIYKLTILRESAGGSPSQNGTLNFKRSKTMSASMSLAEKEKAQLAFLEEIMKDVDAAVTEVLQTKMGLAAAGGMPPVNTYAQAN